MRRIITNLFIVGALILMAIDGLPVLHPLHQRLKEATDPFFDITGLWQGEWSLFAPEPIKVTQWTGVEIVCADGRTLGWESQQWKTVDVVDRFLSFRSTEFHDAIAMDYNRDAWPSFLDYAVRKYGEEEGGLQNIVKASLIRHIQMIPIPGQSETPTQSVVLYTKEYKR